MSDGHNGTFGSCTYPEFKEHVAEFLRMEPTSTLEQVQAGVKAVGIYYLAMEGNDLEAHEAGILWEMVTKRLVDREVQEILSEKD